MARPERARVEDLGRLVGLAEEALGRVLRRRGVRVERLRGVPSVRWADLLAKLDPADVVEARRRTRARGFRVRGNRWIVAGHPHLVAEFHRTKNGDLTPWHVSAGSARKIWWKCPKGPDHEWRTTPNARTSKYGPSGCPFCYDRRVSITNCLATEVPRVARLWHPTRNGAATPRTVSPRTNARYWWKCPKAADHEWKQRVRALAVEGIGCPFCAGRKASSTSSLAARFPRVAAEWHFKRNGGLGPAHVVPGTNRKFWWKCPRGPDHLWRASVVNRALADTGCPFCEGMRVSVTNSLARTAPGLVAEWHRRNGVSPRRVIALSATRYWWKCRKGPDHEWRTPVGSRVGKGIGCPYCAGRRVSVTNSLAAVRPQLAAQWHPTRNGRLTPRDLTFGSIRKVWWKCPRGADHEWRASPAYRASLAVGTCRFCLGRRPSASHCLALLFADVSRWWHPARNGRFDPRHVSPFSPHKHWWRCTAGHSFRRSVWQMTRGTGRCPRCRLRPTAATGRRRRR